MRGDIDLPQHQSGSGKRFMFTVPSMGSVLVSPDGSRGGARIAMWEIWLELAERHAVFAAECRIPGVVLMGTERPEDKQVAGSGEFQHTMLTIAAAAHAIDGLYGSVKRYVQRPASKARRPRQILETLKYGFVVGKLAQFWMVELDWLFDRRDSIVHHSDDYGPLRVVHESEDLLVAIPVELSDLGSESAARAARIAREIADTCRSSPKPVTVDWVRGPANWGPGSGEKITSDDLYRRTFPLVRD